MTRLPKENYIQYWAEDDHTEVMSSNQFAYHVAYSKNRKEIKDVKKLTYKEACKLYDTQPELFKETKIAIGGK